MLVVTRRTGQSILLGHDVEIFVLEAVGSQVRIGVNAPRSVRILRRELVTQVENENRRGAENRAAKPPVLAGLAGSFKPNPEADPE